MELWSDSKYVIDALEKGWARGWQSRGWVKADKKKALNPDLWERLLQLVDYHNVTTVWVKGHAGHPYNERCDTLATSFADSLSIKSKAAASPSRSRQPFCRSAVKNDRIPKNTCKTNGFGL